MDTLTLDFLAGHLRRDILSAITRGGRAQASRRRAGAHAIVIGNGISGIFAARTLSDHFEQVTVLERERLPAELAPRKKLPQAPHSHVLGAHGYAILSAMFPGIDDDLRDAGALRFDCVADFRQFDQGWGPRYPSGLTVRICSRMLLEHTMRRRLLARDNVRLRKGFRVVGLLSDPARTRVLGVVGPDGEQVRGDLVVDASGFASRLSRWLREIGYEAPPRSEVDMKGATASRLFRPDPDARLDWGLINIRLTRTQHRGAALMRIEGGLLRATIVGWAGCHPSRDPDEFLPFLASLPDPLVYQIVKEAEPLSPVYFWGSSRSHWLRYHEMPRFPDGIVTVGDAVFHGNAEHAQGMTICAQAVQALGELLASSPQPVAQRPGFSMAFQRRTAAEIYAPYWIWNTGVELTVPGIAAEQPPLGVRLLHRYYRHVRSLAGDDMALLDAAVRVHHGKQHPASLLHPSVLLRVARHSVRTRKGDARSS